MKKALSILCATVLLCTGMASGAAASADAAVSGQVFDMSSCAFDKLGTWKGENAVLDSLSYDAASGKLRMELKGSPDEQTESILQTMLLGLSAIAEAYPKAVRILK